MLLHQLRSPDSSHRVVRGHDSEHLVAEAAQEIVHHLESSVEAVVVLDQQLVVAEGEWTSILVNHSYVLILVNHSYVHTY